MDYRQLYDNYKISTDYGREQLWRHIMKIVTDSNRRLWLSLVNDDLKQEVFLEADRVIMSWKYPLLVYMYACVRDYHKHYGNLFMTLPMNKGVYCYWNSWCFLDMYIQENRQSESMTKDYFILTMNKAIKFLKTIDKDIIVTLHLVDPNIPKITRYNTICRKYKLTMKQLYDRERLILNRLRKKICKLLSSNQDTNELEISDLVSQILNDSSSAPKNTQKHSMSSQKHRSSET